MNGPSAQQPLAPGDGYTFYREVTDYGADNTGNKDATEAINAAIQDGDRCGMECGNSFSQGAIIYFPVSHSDLFSIPYFKSLRLISWTL